MTLSLRAGIALLATTAVLAGCSTAPTITVPNPLAALNGVFAPAPRVAAAPTYTAPRGTYQQVDAASYISTAPGYASVPSYSTASYGAVDQGYSVPAVDTGSYTLGGIAPSYSTGVTTLGAPSYSTATSFDRSTYTLGSSVAIAPAPSYSTEVPTFGTLAASAPSYSMGVPVTETASYVSEVAPFAEPMTAPIPSYSQAYDSVSQSYGSVQPVQASGTTYDLTAPSMGLETMDPAAGLTIDSSSYATYASPSESMGGSFQVTTPTLGSGVATYSAPTILDSGTFTY